MISRIFSYVFNMQLPISLVFLSAVFFGPIANAESRSEDLVIERAQPSANSSYQGTIGFVNEHSFELIIDDYSFTLPRVLHFNNASWSREQVVQRVKQGDVVKMELGDSAAGNEAYPFTVRSINVINQ